MINNHNSQGWGAYQKLSLGLISSIGIGKLIYDFYNSTEEVQMKKLTNQQFINAVKFILKNCSQDIFEACIGLGQQRLLDESHPDHIPKKPQNRQEEQQQTLQFQVKKNPYKSKSEQTQKRNVT